ncbi:MAG: hypothetical protein Q4P16_05745 [Spirochaetales bacterium]|nr:hypothetical protein [Spirochaetales bacterium]
MSLFKKFPFKDKPNTAAITCVHILDEKKPILFVSQDDDDGCWQFLCDKEHNIEGAKVISLQQIYEADKSIKKIANLEYGKCAYRKDKNSKWNVQ